MPRGSLSKAKRHDANGWKIQYGRTGQGNGNIHGDVHTAVRWYLEWVHAERKLPSDLQCLFRIACFQKMDERAPSFKKNRANELLVMFDNWRVLLTWRFSNCAEVSRSEVDVEVQNLRGSFALRGGRGGSVPPRKLRLRDGRVGSSPAQKLRVARWNC